MKLALIPPYCLLEETFRTDYQLMLPQLAVADDRYRAIYSKHCNDLDTFVILDNGAAEGVEFPVAELINMAYTYKVSEIVVPDVIGDKDATIELANEFCAIFDAGVISQHYYNFYQQWSDFQFMFVVQGQTLMEVLSCAHWAAEQDWITTIGIPRHLLKTLDDCYARIRVANMLGVNYPKEVHFLGGSSAWSLEYRQLTNKTVTQQDNLRGMDTSMPFNYAFANHFIDTPIQVDRPERYFERNLHEFNQYHLEWNITTMCDAFDTK